MTKKSFNLRNVVKIGVTCLAVCMMFVACDKNNGNGDDPNNPDNPGGNGSGLSTWTKVTSPLTTPFYCIAYGNGKFVAGSDNSTVAISSDNGKTWTTKKIVESNHRINSIIYANGKFVAMVGQKVCQTQNPDGDWAMMADLESLGLGIIRVIYYDDTRYIIGGADGKMAYSTDLANWTTKTINLFASGYNSIYGFAFGKGQLVVTGAGGIVA